MSRIGNERLGGILSSPATPAVRVAMLGRAVVEALGHRDTPVAVAQVTGLDVRTARRAWEAALGQGRVLRWGHLKPGAYTAAQVVTWALGQRRRATERLVLVALASRANLTLQEASEADLASLLGLHVRTVQKALLNLWEAGLVEKGKWGWKMARAKRPQTGAQTVRGKPAKTSSRTGRAGHLEGRRKGKVEESNTVDTVVQVNPVEGEDSYYQSQEEQASSVANVLGEVTVAHQGQGEQASSLSQSQNPWPEVVSMNPHGTVVALLRAYYRAVAGHDPGPKANLEGQAWGVLRKLRARGKTLAWLSDFLRWVAANPFWGKKYTFRLHVARLMDSLAVARYEEWVARHGPGEAQAKAEERRRRWLRLQALPPGLYRAAPGAGAPYVRIWDVGDYWATVQYGDSPEALAARNAFTVQTVPVERLRGLVDAPINSW